MPEKGMHGLNATQHSTKSNNTNCPLEVIWFSESRKCYKHFEMESRRFEIQMRMEWIEQIGGNEIIIIIY